VDDNVASSNFEWNLEDVRPMLEKSLAVLHAKIASKTKKFQPAANPMASSMYRLANLMNGEEMGR
jgi:hypothetical protein